MSKFDDILSKYSKIIEEMPVSPQQLDLTKLDKATGEQIQQGLAELMGNDPDKINTFLSGLVNSKAINAPVVGATQATPSTSTTPSSTTGTTGTKQAGATQNNPAANAERRAVSQITP